MDKTCVLPGEIGQGRHVLLRRVEGPASSQQATIDWRRVAADKNVAIDVARGLWEQAKAAMPSDDVGRSNLFRRLIEDAAKNPAAAKEPGKQNLVDTKGPVDPASLGPGKTTQVLLNQDQKANDAAPVAGNDVAAAPGAAAPDAKKAEESPTAPPTVAKLHHDMVAAAQAGQDAAAQLAAADPATIMEVLHQIRAGDHTLLQKIINVLGAAIERRLGDVLPDPEQKPDGPPGISVPILGGDGEVQMHTISEAGVPMMATKPISEKVAEWRAEIVNRADEQEFVPKLSRAASLETTTGDQAKKAKLGDEVAKTALPDTQKQLAASLGSISRQIHEVAQKSSTPPASSAATAQPAAPDAAAPDAAAPTASGQPAALGSPADAAPASAAPMPTAPAPLAPMTATPASQQTGAAQPSAAPQPANQGDGAQGGATAQPPGAQPATQQPAAQQTGSKDQQPAADKDNEQEPAVTVPVPVTFDAYRAHIRATFAAQIAVLDQLAEKFAATEGEATRLTQPFTQTLEEVAKLQKAFDDAKATLDEEKINRAAAKLKAATLAQPNAGSTMPQLLEKAKKLVATIKEKGEDAAAEKKQLEGVMQASMKLGTQIDKTSTEKGRALYVEIDENENPALVEKARAAGMPAKDVAEMAVNHRNWLRALWRNEIMKDKNHSEILFLRDEGKTGSRDGQSFQQVIAKVVEAMKTIDPKTKKAALSPGFKLETATPEELDEIYRGVIESAGTTNAGVNATAGVGDKPAAQTPRLGAEADSPQTAAPPPSQLPESKNVEPMAEPTTMSGEKHTLHADPATGNVEMHSIPGFVVEKLQSIVELVPVAVRKTATTALAIALETVAAVGDPALKAGGEASERSSATQRVRTKLKDLAEALRLFGNTGKITDANPAAVQRARLEEERHAQQTAQVADAATTTSSSATTTPTTPPPTAPPAGLNEPNELKSADGKSEALELTYKEPADQQKLKLNDEFEHHLQANLEHGTVPIAKKMSDTVGGYQTFAGAQQFIKDNLASDKEDVEHAHKEGTKTVGDESSLIALLTNDPRFKDVEKGSYTVGPPTRLDQARANVQFLKNHKGAVDQLPADCEGIKRQFRKIFYTVKLAEMLLSQMGYFGGSLEFKMGLEDDLEYWVYLLSTKTRGPQQQMLSPAPKPMEPYRTPESTLLPTNNQFSMSIGHAEFESADSIPANHRTELEQKLADFQGLGAGGIEDTGKHAEAVRKLNALVGKNPKAPDTQSWTLAELIFELRDENKRKTLFTDLLRVSWATENYQRHGDKTENPFSGQASRETALAPADIKDPRIQEEAASAGVSPQIQLGETDTRGHVTGKQANVLLTAASASAMFRKKLERLTEDDLATLYGQKLTIDEIVQDATDKVDAWYKNARENNKPIYSGPSGHTLGYLNLYKDAYNGDQASGAPTAGKPNLEQARLVMIASLTGSKGHHSYDEVLVASQGIRTNDGAPGNSLHYKSPASYADMIASQTNGLSDGAAQKAKAQTEAEAKEVDPTVLEQWKNKVLKP